MTRAELTTKIAEIKRTKQLTWQQIARDISDGSPIIATAALFGQMRLTADEAARAARVLDLSDAEAQLLTEIPYRGSLPAGPPTDPLIYRLHEMISVYGTTLKALIEEEFGDGIMSAIDFDMTMQRLADPKGDRVQLTLSGKFLPYRRY
jgi:cyanate lyase